MTAKPPDSIPPARARPADLDFAAQRLRANLRAKMFGIESGPVRIGRFAVLGPLGEGGTGVVYAAYDDRLDRKVAVKVLTKPSNPGCPDRERILREARNLAQVSHENVVAVYEVGTVRKRVFLAMEFVDGITVADWQLAKARSWREILDVYQQAGRGLAAAHRAGIVHRDVKPANLLLGHDGRVLVVDFGLARPDRSDNVSADPTESAAQELEVTQTGDLVGTPAYMAPEQVARQTAGPAADQFSFCVALFEALFGDRPHAGRTSAQVLLAIVDGGKAKAPRGTPVPRQICEALERGLSRDPDDRFENMEALLAALVPPRSRAPIVFTTAALVTAGLGATWVVTPSPRCEATLGDAWNDVRRAAVVDAFIDTRLPGAEETARSTVEAIDAYGSAWVVARNQACDQAPDLLDRRIACFDRRRRSIVTFTEVLLEPDADVIERALDGALGLPSLGPCADEAGLRSATDPPHPEQAAAVSAVRVLVDEARSQSVLGHYRDGLRVATRSVEHAREIGYAPALAEALLEQGKALAKLDRGGRSGVALHEAADLAEAARHDTVAAEAWIELAYVRGSKLEDLPAALEAARRADASIERAGGDRTQRGELQRALGLAHYFSGDIEAARSSFESALALLGEKQDVRRARVEANYADALAWAGEIEAALPRFEAARSILAAKLGDRHPRVGMTHFAYGLGLQAAGRYDEARVRLDAALDIYVGAFGERSSKVAAALEARAKLELEAGRYAHGLPAARRALEIREEIDPSAKRANAVILLAELEHASGRPAAALLWYGRALVILDDVGHAETAAVVQANVAVALHEAGRKTPAREAMQRARARFIELGEPAHPAWLQVEAIFGESDDLVR